MGVKHCPADVLLYFLRSFVFVKDFHVRFGFVLSPDVGLREPHAQRGALRAGHAAGPDDGPAEPRVRQDGLRADAHRHLRPEPASTARSACCNEQPIATSL